MKRNIFWSGILAVALIFGMMITACPADDGGGSGEGDGGNWTWNSYDDSANNGTSTITMTQGTGANSNKLTFTGNVTNDAANFLGGTGYAGFIATPNSTELAKLKTALSISFKVKGNGNRVTFVLPTSDITDWSHFYTTFTTSTTETTVTIKISDLQAPYWGQGMTTGFNQNKVTEIKFEIDDPGPFDITISDLTLNGGTDPNPGTGGTFTLTGIPSKYNGKYAFLVGEGGNKTWNEEEDDYSLMVLGFQSANMSTGAMTLVPISNGSVSIPLWVQGSQNSIVRYSGNDTCDYVQIYICNSQTDAYYTSMIAGGQFNSVTFSNGGATRAWSQGQFYGD